MGDLRRSKRKRVSSSSADPRNEALERTSERTTRKNDTVPKVTLSADDLIDSNTEWYAYKYPDSECAHDYENNGYAQGNIEGAMDNILRDFTKKGVTLATRMNGVASCIDIADSVTRAFDQMGSHDVVVFGDSSDRRYNYNSCKDFYNVREERSLGNCGNRDRGAERECRRVWHFERTPRCDQDFERKEINFLTGAADNAEKSSWAIGKIETTAAFGNV